MDAPTTLDKSFHEYLPAIYQKDNDLHDLLSAFAEHFIEIDKLLSKSDQRVNPQNPEYGSGDTLRWLASWIDLDLDDDWGEARKRQLISKAIELYRKRGTKGGLKEYLKIYTGLDAKIEEDYEPGGFQIGVASRIGGFEKRDSNKQWTKIDVLDVPMPKENERRDLETDDYYVVTQQAGPTWIYHADKVKKVKIEEGTSQYEEYPFNITICCANAEDQREKKPLENAKIVRYDDLPIPLTWHDQTTADYEYQYLGDTILKTSEEIPFSIIIELSGPSLKGLENQLASERRHLTEEFFAGRNTKSKLGDILSYLTDNTNRLITDVVLKSDLALQPIDCFLAGQVDYAQLASEIKTQLEKSVISLYPQEKPELNPRVFQLDENGVRQCHKIAHNYIEEMYEHWLGTCEDKEYRKQLIILRQRQEFTEICQIHFAEVLLKTLSRARKGEKGPAENKDYLSPVAQIERYLASDLSEEEMPESIRRVHRLLEREKPIHVGYSLRFREESSPPPPPMQISIHSRVGVSTVIG